jgi:hypothetical protein
VLSRRKDNEIELLVYDYGFAYITGLSDPVCVRQTAQVFKIKRRYRCSEFGVDTMIIRTNKAKRKQLSLRQRKHMRRMRQETRRVATSDDQKKNGVRLSHPAEG